MSTQFETPGQRGRPASVSIAVYTQFAVGAIALISAIIAIVQTSQLMNRVRELTADVEVEGLQKSDVQTALSIVQAITYVMIIGTLLFGLAVALMGIFNLKGKNGTRITTWVLAGLGLLCGICGSIGGAASSLGGGGSQAANDELTKAFEKAALEVPGWYGAASLVFTVLDVILYLAIIILLAVPASNDFFRKPRPEVDVMLPPEAYQDKPMPPAPGVQPPPPGTQPPAPGTQPPPSGPDDGTPKP